MPFRKAVFYVSHRPGCAEIALDCAARLAAHGVRVTAPGEYCAEEARTALGAQPEAAAIDGADVAVVIGGDGSILRAARALAPRGVPILGVNMGRIGFMSELEPTELDAIDAMCRGDYETEERMMLRTTVRRGEELLLDAHSLNDVTVNRAENHRRPRRGAHRGQIPRRRRDCSHPDGLYGLFYVGGRPDSGADAA